MLYVPLRHDLRNQVGIKGLAVWISSIVKLSDICDIVNHSAIAGNLEENMKWCIQQSDPPCSDFETTSHNQPLLSQTAPQNHSDRYKRSKIHQQSPQQNLIRVRAQMSLFVVCSASPTRTLHYRLSIPSTHVIETIPYTPSMFPHIQTRTCSSITCYQRSTREIILITYLIVILSRMKDRDRAGSISCSNV